MENALLTRAEAAKYLGLSPNTLASWATESPPRLKMVKIGTRVMYRPEDLKRFVNENVIGGKLGK